jgi:hypothetical protein
VAAGKAASLSAEASEDASSSQESSSSSPICADVNAVGKGSDFLVGQVGTENRRTDSRSEGCPKEKVKRFRSLKSDSTSLGQRKHPAVSRTRTQTP